MRSVIVVGLLSHNASALGEPRGTGDPVLAEPAASLAQGEGGAEQSLPATVQRGPLDSESPEEPSFPGTPLEDWVHPDTGTTSRFYKACGVVLELQLSTTGPRNYATITFLNSTSASVVFRPDQSEVTLNGNRRFLIPAGVWDDRIQPDWWQQGTFAFPDKSAFRFANRLELLFRFYVDEAPCDLVAVVERDPTLPRSASSYRRSSTGEMLFDVRAPVRAFGDRLGAGGNYGGGYNLSFGFFPWVPEHGFSIDLGGVFLGNTGVERLENQLDLEGDETFSEVSILAGYNFKRFLTPTLAVHYGLLGGLNLLELGTVAETVRIEAFGEFRQRVRFLFHRREPGLVWGPGVFHSWRPDGGFVGTSVAGHTLGISLGVGMSN